MHPDPVGDLLHLERLDRLRPVGEEARLVVDDRLGRPQERAAALLDRLDEPLGRIDFPLDVLARLRRRGRVGKHLAVQRADPQIRQIDLLEAHFPGTVLLQLDMDVGLDHRHVRNREAGPRLRLERMEIVTEPLDLLDREPGLPGDQRQAIGAEVLEVV